MALFKKFKVLFKKLKKKPAPKPKKVEVVKSEVKKPLVKRPPVKKKDLREIYRILKEPHISEKATVLAEQNKYIFKVYPQANKIETEKAIENLYGVKVKDVNIINVHRKRRVLRGVEGFKTGYKKAIVTLEKGEKIEIIPH
jgi:large subunit ribosomal protein L23